MDIFDIIYSKMARILGGGNSGSHLKHTRPSNKNTRDHRKIKRQMTRESRRKNRS